MDTLRSPHRGDVAAHQSSESDGYSIDELVDVKLALFRLHFVLRLCRESFGDIVTYLTAPPQPQLSLEERAAAYVSGFYGNRLTAEDVRDPVSTYVRLLGIADPRIPIEPANLQPSTDTLQIA